MKSFCLRQKEVCKFKFMFKFQGNININSWTLWKPKLQYSKFLNFKFYKIIQHFHSIISISTKKIHFKINTVLIDLKFKSLSLSLSFNLNCNKCEKLEENQVILREKKNISLFLPHIVSLSAVGTLSWLIWKQIEFQFSSLYKFFFFLSHSH